MKSSAAAAATAVALRGIVVIVPLTITLYVIFWAFALLENIMRRMLAALLPDQLYFPGAGLICLVGLVFLAGIALKEVHVEAGFKWFERFLLKVPLVKSIYSVSKDFLEYAAADRENRELGEVVAIDFPEADCKLVGFITEDDPGKHASELEGNDTVAVYLPMGYQIGGYTIFVSRKRVEHMDMPFEDALRFILTAGVSRKQEETEKELAV